MADVNTSGPLFDGRAAEIIDRYVDAVRHDVAQEGENRIHAVLGTVLRQNTGRYESMIHTERQVNDLAITDTPIVYGPWLEGEGSRNFPRTRFRGYHTFRNVSQTLEADAGDIAERTLHDGGYLQELNS